MSDTPRTDAAICRYTGGEVVTFPAGLDPVVSADFARGLERELAAKDRELAEAREIAAELATSWRARCAEVERELAEARERLEYLYNGEARTSSTALVQLETRVLRGDKISVNEVEQAIDKCRREAGEVIP